MRTTFSCARSFVTQTAKRIWFATRAHLPHRLYVPKRAASLYRTMIWGDASPSSQAAVPKTIWSYWEGEASQTVSLCLKSWHQNNPGWTINLITPESLRQHLPDFPHLPATTPPQKVSNLVRLLLLERYGGIWVDASTVVTSRLDWIASDVSSLGCEAGLFWNERAGIYKKNLEFPIIENGFICAPPGSKFIRSWRKSYEECISSPDYESYFLAKPNYSDLIASFEQSRNLSYFVCYMAAQETMRRSRNFRLLLINVEDEFYYYYYFTKKPRNRRHFAEALLLTPQSNSDGSRLIKITNGHRGLLDDYLAHRCYRRDSILGQFATDAISD